MPAAETVNPERSLRVPEPELMPPAAILQERFVARAISRDFGEVSLVFEFDETGVPRSGVRLYDWAGVRIDAQQAGPLSAISFNGPVNVDPRSRPVLRELFYVLMTVLGEAGFTVVYDAPRSSSA